MKLSERRARERARQGKGPVAPAVRKVQALINKSEGVPVDRAHFGGIVGYFLGPDPTKETPTQARARGMSYRGPRMADKGQRDGSCNRTACQLPLAGRVQWSMWNHDKMCDEPRLHYCEHCARIFNSADFESGSPQRCRLELDTVPEGLRDRYMRRARYHSDMPHAPGARSVRG